jgi:hypothetical protein
MDRRSNPSVSSPRLVFFGFVLVVTAALAAVAYITPLNANDLLKHLFRFEALTLGLTLGTNSSDRFRSQPTGAHYNCL